MSRAAIDEVVERLAAEDIRIVVTPSGEALFVDVLETGWSQPHTWLTIFLEFLRSGYCVTIR